MTQSVKTRFFPLTVLCLFLVGAGAKAAQTPVQVVNGLLNKAKATKSYTYEWTYDGVSKDGKSHKGEKFKLDFLAPNFRRMTIVQRDAFSNGAVVIYNPTVNANEVVGKKFMIRKTYKKNDPQIDGYFDTDLLSIANKINLHFKGSKNAKVTATTLDGKKVTLLEFAPVGKPITQVKVWVDAKDMIARKVEFFTAKGLQDRRHFTSYAFTKFAATEFVH